MPSVLLSLWCIILEIAQDLLESLDYTGKTSFSE